MSVIDIFSRFLFLRPLQTKETSDVAEHLLDIYMEHGPPEILQSDQGPEFKGVVKTVCEALNVRIVKSSAYSPQTQGKEERHRTWKEKLRFDLCDLNWVEYLQHYQQLYNESPHRSLGFLSPFEVYFGKKPNRIRNKLFLVGKKECEVLEENNSNFETGDSKREELLELEIERDAIRQEALDASNEAAQYTVKRELRRNPPSLYYKGETVLIRIPISKKIVKGKRTP
ncbi:KRAB-A domain-containing protein 2-like [Montipora capricornis]|uniref:KRAB-A domain-containing protein 2-like n=1 Tax=Montipora capricornis TaxID=246305 RepID=UPI0035F179E3